MNRKLQFHPEPIALRSVEQYSELSKQAERTKSNVYGHFGRSVIEDLLDVPLPDAIVLDYLHVTLLGHAKVVTLAIYNQLRPAQRKQLDIDLNKQSFPRKKLTFIFFSLNLITQVPCLSDSFRLFQSENKVDRQLRFRQGHRSEELTLLWLIASFEFLVTYRSICSSSNVHLLDAFTTQW